MRPPLIEMPPSPERRRFLLALAAGAGGAALVGCDRVAGDARVKALLAGAEPLTYRAQRLVLDRAALAPEYGEMDLSPVFRANGTQDPGGEAYGRMVRESFSDFRLVVDGLVRQPLALSLAQLKRLPMRTQITRHDCVEGWSAIGKWHGVPLRTLLALSGIQPGARFAVFHCADNLNGADSDDRSGQYYESIDLIDAVHPQTILAYGMNGQSLAVAHGAPLRLRVERQLGYKQAKYVMRVELVESLAGLGGGKGGYWEDRGYQWYAGI